MATDFTVDRDTVKYVLNSSGDIASVAIDTPAIEYNTDGTYKGLLVEPASTNLCLQSEDISTGWFTLNTTITTNDTTAPDGTTTADKLGDDGGGGTGEVRIGRGIVTVSGTKYTYSVFLKADQLGWGYLEFQDYAAGGLDAYQYFDLSGAGSLGGGNADAATIEEYPNGWYRCSITKTVGDTGFNALIQVADSNGGKTVDLDGTSSIFVWGAQVEASPIATSYIPTTTASVTRNKDDISLTGASDLIGQSEGTLYVEVDWREATGTSQMLLNTNNQTPFNRALIYVASGNVILYVVVDGSVVSNVGASTSGFSGIQKIALAYADGDQELYRNGSSIATATGSLAGWATRTDIDLGQNRTASAQANMWIRAVALYKTRLTNDQLADLTS